MRWLNILRLRFRSLFRRATLELDLEDELRFHFDRHVEQNIAMGMDAEEARAAALREFGPLALHKDECRDARRTRLVESFWDDTRYAVRNLRRDWFLALTATATLAICIGANTTVFSIANSILIRPLPYPNSDRIDWISERSGPAQQDVGAAPDYFMIREQNRTFAEVGAFDSTIVNWTGVDTPEQVDAATVSPSFFGVMGTQPLLGRTLTPEEMGLKAPAVAILSYVFWRNRFGGDARIIGKTIALDRLPHTIVGVMPQGFDFPQGANLWVPNTLLDRATQSFPLAPNSPIAIVSIIGRRRPEVKPLEVVTEMKRLALAIGTAYPQRLRSAGFRKDLSLSSDSLQEYSTGPVRPAILVLSGAVVLVLLIACTNIANLLLARASSRHRELAVRLALGSGRARITRQMLTESLVLAAPGTVAGGGLAWLALRLLDYSKPAVLWGYRAISMDWRVLAFTIGLMIVTSVLFGFVPALSAAGIHIQDALKSAGLAHSVGRGATRLRKLLVVSELGISLVLLISAGLLARSFLHLAHSDLGFPTEHLLTFRINPVGFSFFHDYGPFYSDIQERIRHLPGVRSTALADDIPLGPNQYPNNGAIQVVGRPLVPLIDRPRISDRLVSPDFFRTLGIRLKRGRIFDPHDFAGIPSSARPEFLRREAVVVNAEFVRRIFPGEDPLGRQLRFGPDDLNATWTIVGVVSNIRSTALGADPLVTVYRCTCAGAPIYLSGFLVRTSVAPESTIRSIEQQIRMVDRDQPISDVKTMDQLRDAALAPERFQLLLLGSFAAIAIVLAAAGVYGTMSYLVTRRTREICIRMAMGARPGDVVGMVLSETSLLTVVAIAGGLGGAWALTRYIRSMLYGVTALDPATLILTSVLLAAIVLMASVGPVRRAVRVDPISALRDD
jgi:putative ABC transport system permease protein